MVSRPKMGHLALCPYVYSALCAVIPTLANFKANVLLIICFNEKPILKSEFSSMWRAVKTELIHSMFYNVPLIECKSQDKILFIAKNRVKS